VAEVYASLGVDASRIVVQRLTLPHLETLVPRSAAGAHRPLTFVAPGAGAHPTKGSRVLCDAVEALERAGRGDDYRLVVPGRIEPEALERLAVHPGVRLTGIYRPEDLDELLDGADVGLLPSIWEESHGFVGVEMLAKGLPVIGSDLGGIPEYVRDGETGWLNRSATGAELAELMARALDDVAAVERLRRSVRAQRADLVVPMAEHAREVEALYQGAQGRAYPLPAAQAG
jgi:glycosyltransferase involved in cell wall biosynthesis